MNGEQGMNQRYEKNPVLKKKEASLHIVSIIYFFQLPCPQTEQSE